MTNTPTIKATARRTVALLGATLVTLGALAILAEPAQAYGNHRITIAKYMYMPMAVTIEEGETVTWTNEDPVAHDVTATSGPVSFQSPMLAKGESWSHTFTVAGPYSYICSVHPDMTATLTVTAVPVAAPAASKPTVVSPANTGTVAQARASSAPAVATAARQEASGPNTVSTPLAQSAALPQVVSAPQSAATLQPLLLVVGASVAAVVFCLLLMASRPVLAEVAVAGGEDEDAAANSLPKHLDES